MHAKFYSSLHDARTHFISEAITNIFLSLQIHLDYEFSRKLLIVDFFILWIIND